MQKAIIRLLEVSTNNHALKEAAWYRWF